MSVLDRNERGDGGGGEEEEARKKLNVESHVQQLRYTDTGF
jgi:hypothetical protein